MDNVTRNECILKHKPMEESMKRIESRLNWFTITLILTLGGVVTQLVFK